MKRLLQLPTPSQWRSPALLLVVCLGSLIGSPCAAVGAGTGSDDAKLGPANATYRIEGQEVHLIDGVAQRQAAPGSATKVRTTIFGEPAWGDLNGDGVDDAALFLVYSPGGSGTFVYVAAATREGDGYKGTDAVLLGDRVAPQTVSVRNGVIVVAYADRLPNEPMASPPTVGVAKCLALRNGKLVETSNPDFEGSSEGIARLGSPTPPEVTEPERPARRFLALPYPFYNDTIGPGIGVAAIAEGYVQPRMLAVGSGLFSSEGTYLVFALVRNYQFPWLDRIILEPQASIGEFRKIESYVNGNPDFPNERAGSNGSSQDNFIEADGSDEWIELRMRYVLPMGEGKTDVLPRPSVENGVPAPDGAKSWNPLVGGRTSLELTPFYRNQDLDDEDNTRRTTFGFDLALSYDNTDYRINPSTGGTQRLFVSRDWGGLDSTSPWTVAGADLTQHFSLGASELARQRVLVVNLWTVDCLTWSAGNRPPPYKGANLGGLWRMRGYPATRFNDRAAIYYGAEYRYTLGWNPLKELTLGGRLDVDWLQLVAFGELGRVAPEWDLGTLHSQMKWSAGGGLRTMVNHLVLRADLGISEESAIVQLFIGQPF